VAGAFVGESLRVPKARAAIPGRCSPDATNEKAGAKVDVRSLHSLVARSTYSDARELSPRVTLQSRRGRQLASARIQEPIMLRSIAAVVAGYVVMAVVVMLGTFASGGRCSYH